MAQEHLIDYGKFLCRKAKKLHFAGKPVLAKASLQQAIYVAANASVASDSALQILINKTKSILNAVVAPAGYTASATGVVNNRVAITSHYTASTNDYYIGVQSTASLGIKMPAASSLSIGQSFLIKDESGNANSYNITINPNGSDTIEGGNSVILSIQYASISLHTDGVSKFFIY